MNLRIAPSHGALSSVLAGVPHGCYCCFAAFCRQALAHLNLHDLKGRTWDVCKQKMLSLRCTSSGALEPSCCPGRVHGGWNPQLQPGNRGPEWRGPEQPEVDVSCEWATGPEV
ncbi:uncharacterized protein LOC141572763 isoform X3 [Rhinolophus sinicus]|uniref:uncharacterized protein LOC141572763 isoform X3 n=1 Tax=Rhinolophus sinicus TaxID=89399 RepID=UPI003D7ADBD0